MHIAKKNCCKLHIINVSFKLLKFQIMIDFPSGPKFIKLKNSFSLKILRSTYMKVSISIWPTFLPPNTPESDSNDTTFIIAT